MIPLLLLRIAPEAAAPGVEAASLDFSVLGMRLHWTARGAPAHYTMKMGRCHFDA